MAALAAVPAPLTHDDARQFAAGPSTGYLRGFAQALRGLWWSVAGTGGADERDWRNGLADCQDFYAEHGNLNVPASASGSQVRRLRAWVSRRRADYEAGILTEDQIAALETCGMQWRRRARKPAAGDRREPHRATAARRCTTWPDPN